MVSRVMVWARGIGFRRLARVVAVFVGLANLIGVILWFGLDTFAGEGASLGEVLPSTFLVVIAGLVAAEIVLRVSEVSGRGFSHCYKVIVTAFCLGGVIEGELLGWLFTLDGTLGAGTFTDIFADGPIFFFVTLAWAFIPGLVGAAFGLVAGLAEGLILGLPLAAAVVESRNEASEIEAT